MLPVSVGVMPQNKNRTNSCLRGSEAVRGLWVCIPLSVSVYLGKKKPFPPFAWRDLTQGLVTQAIGELRSAKEEDTVRDSQQHIRACTPGLETQEEKTVVVEAWAQSAHPRINLENQNHRSWAVWEEEPGLVGAAGYQFYCVLLLLDQFFLYWEKSCFVLFFKLTQ